MEIGCGQHVRHAKSLADIALPLNFAHKQRFAPNVPSTPFQRDVRFRVLVNCSHDLFPLPSWASEELIAEHVRLVLYQNLQTLLAQLKNFYDLQEYDGPINSAQTGSLAPAKFGRRKVCPHGLYQFEPGAALVKMGSVLPSTAECTRAWSGLRAAIADRQRRSDDYSFSDA